jgi:hypothetical protein
MLSDFEHEISQEDQKLQKVMKNADDTMKVCLPCAMIIRLFQMRHSCLVFLPLTTTTNLDKFKETQSRHWTDQQTDFMLDLYTKPITDKKLPQDPKKVHEMKA